MNYWGTNKKVKVESTEWEGPRARLAKTKWLNEVIVHEIKIDAMRSVQGLEDALMRKSRSYPNWEFTTERHTFEMVYKIIAPRGELIEAGFING